MLNILTHNLTIHFFAQLFVDHQHLGQILPATRRRKCPAVYRRLHPVKIRRSRTQVRNNGRMQLVFHRILFPHREIRLHLNLFHTVHRHNVKFTNRFVVFRRISGCYDHPALRNLMISKHLTLKELQHRRSQRL